MGETTQGITFAQGKNGLDLSKDEEDLFFGFSAFVFKPAVQAVYGQVETGPDVEKGIADLFFGFSAFVFKPAVQAVYRQDH